MIRFLLLILFAQGPGAAHFDPPQPWRVMLAPDGAMLTISTGSLERCVGAQCGPVFQEATFPARVGIEMGGPKGAGTIFAVRGPKAFEVQWSDMNGKMHRVTVAPSP